MHRSARGGISIDEFARLASGEGGGATHLCRLATVSTDSAASDTEDRIVRYVFSTNAPARDRNTINQNGWDFTGFDNYRAFLWAHDDTSPPIGNVISHSVLRNELLGSVRYVEREVYPFADMIYQMVKRKIISAVSVSWLPLEWKWSTDKDRQGGIDFIRQDLLEISQVPVPAQATAIATARAAGIDTTPAAEWAERKLDGGAEGSALAQLCAARRAAISPPIYHLIKGYR